MWFHYIYQTIFQIVIHTSLLLLQLYSQFHNIESMSHPFQSYTEAMNMDSWDFDSQPVQNVHLQTAPLYPSILLLHGLAMKIKICVIFTVIFLTIRWMGMTKVERRFGQKSWLRTIKSMLKRRGQCLQSRSFRED